MTNVDGGVRPDSSGVRDDVLYKIGEGPAAAAPMVGNEQLATAEGVKGPDPAQWDDQTARTANTVVQTPPGYYKGPSKTEWGPVARAERGADPSDNPVGTEAAEPVAVVTDDDVPAG